MQITMNTDELSELDIAVLRFLAGMEDGEPEAEAEPEPVAKKTRAKKAPEPEEDLLGSDSPTLADAVAVATTLVANGEAGKVKAALTEIGVKRVNELADDNIVAFLAALEA